MDLLQNKGNFTLDLLQNKSNFTLDLLQKKQYLSVDNIELTDGTKYELYNMPYYYAGQIESFVKSKSNIFTQ